MEQGGRQANAGVGLMGAAFQGGVGSWADPEGELRKEGRVRWPRQCRDGVARSVALMWNCPHPDCLAS